MEISLWLPQKLSIIYFNKTNFICANTALDQSCSTASGCSIDKLVSFIKNIENEYQISLLDRLDISFRDKNKISVLRLDDFKRKILEKKINNDTIVFNNLINLKSDLANNWEIPLNRSWHQKLIK